MTDTEARTRYKGMMICICSFLINTLTMGIMFNFGIMLPTFLDEFNAGRTLTALVGSCQVSLMLVLGPLSGSFIDWCGIRNISIAGGFIYSVGLISASYVNSIYGLFPTFALIFAVAASLLFSAISIAPVKCMSSEYQGIACALVSSSGPTGMLSFSLIIPFLLEQFHWQIMFRILAYFGVIICLLSLTYGWIEEVRDISEKRKLFCDMSLCKRPRFFVFMFGSSVSMLGWSVGNLFLADRAKSYGIHENKSKWFYFAIGIVSIPSAFLAGKIGDMIKHRVRMTIICLFLHGINTLLSYLYKTYITMFIYSIFSGMLNGIYNAVLCVAILDCVGEENIAQGFGFLVAFQGAFLSLGPPIAGLLRDTTGTFKLPLIVAGCFQILGALLSIPSATIQRREQDVGRDCEKKSIAV